MAAVVLITLHMATLLSKLWLINPGASLLTWFIPVVVLCGVFLIFSSFLIEQHAIFITLRRIFHNVYAKGRDSITADDIAGGAFPDRQTQLMTLVDAQPAVTRYNWVVYYCILYEYIYIYSICMGL